MNSNFQKKMYKMKFIYKLFYIIKNHFFLDNLLNFKEHKIFKKKLIQNKERERIEEKIIKLNIIKISTYV